MVGKQISFIAQKRNQAMNDFEKHFHTLLNNSFYGKTMKNVKKTVKIEFIKKDDNEKIIKQQSKSTLSGIHKSTTIYHSYTSKQKEVLIDKPFYLGLDISELNKLLLYGTIYVKLQTYFGQENNQSNCKDTDSFVLSMNTKDVIKYLKNLQDIFEFSNLDENHEIVSNKKIIGKFKIETLKNLWIAEFVCLKSKMYAVKRGDDRKKNERN